MTPRNHVYWRVPRFTRPSGLWQAADRREAAECGVAASSDVRPRASRAVSVGVVEPVLAPPMLGTGAQHALLLDQALVPFSPVIGNKAGAVEGCAETTCLECGRRDFELGSGDVAEAADLQPTRCPCGGDTFDVAAGLAVRDTGEIRWIYLGVRCVRDGVLGCPVDWDPGTLTTADLVGQERTISGLRMTGRADVPLKARSCSRACWPSCCSLSGLRERRPDREPTGRAVAAPSASRTGASCRAAAGIRPRP